ncbi:MAG: septal ring lytic transglycosylase RlpA family protein [Candidatus Omnitrophota bacterium]
MKNLKIPLLIVLMLAFMLQVKDAGSSHTILQGNASWYSESDPGILRTTANMEVFDHEMLTCAMWDMPFNTLLKVTNVYNGRCVYVRVNDRGPAKRLVNRGRIIDLTKEAFSKLADLKEGLIQIRVEVI